jgi:hypothetical protein
VLCAILGLAALARRGPLWRAAAILGLVGAVALWWALIPSRNDRDWQPDVARLPWATLDGGQLTIHNVRNFT